MSTSEIPPSSLVGEDGDGDRTEPGGIKKVCFKVLEEDQEDSGHDTVSYRDSYRWVLTLQRLCRYLPGRRNGRCGVTVITRGLTWC